MGYTSNMTWDVFVQILSETPNKWWWNHKATENPARLDRFWLLKGLCCRSYLQKCMKDWNSELLMMEEILHHLIGSSSHYLRVFYIPAGAAGFLPKTVWITWISQWMMFWKADLALRPSRIFFTCMSVFLIGFKGFAVCFSNGICPGW